jgi:hypothetical protein
VFGFTLVGSCKSRAVSQTRAQDTQFSNNFLFEFYFYFFEMNGAKREREKIRALNMQISDYASSVK